ncbi:MAG: class I SAM-dependent methyltransferase [Methanospirillum sp.]|nr:class I SAM-dependent methyltransferase [Methanospirillum sp.]
MIQGSIDEFLLQEAAPAMTTETNKRNSGSGNALNGEKRNFDSEAATWDKEPGRVKLANDVAQAISEMVSLTPEMDVLDFGCGTGLLTLRIQPLVRSITGIDSSQGMLNVLDTKIRKQGITNVRTRLADITRGVLFSGEYDLVVSSMTLHHIKDLPFLLKAMAGVTRPSGQVAVIDLDCDGGKFHDSNEGVFHFGFDRSIMKNHLEAAGFVSIRYQTAAIMQRLSPSGETRDFTIFLMTGRKPE